MNVIIPIGYAFFDKNKYSNSTLQKLLTIKRKEILYKKEKWKIDEDGYDKKWKIIFESMLECQAFILALDSNRYFGIIDSLTNVKFSRLKELNLENNNILTVQRLSCLDMPQITAIYLGMNLINTIKPFRKNNLKQLQYMDLSNNPINQLTYFSEFSNSYLTKFVLQWSDNRVISENIVWAFKIPAQTLKFIRIQSNKRIRQPNVDNMLLQRERNALIWRRPLIK